MTNFVIGRLVAAMASMDVDDEDEEIESPSAPWTTLVAQTRRTLLLLI